MTYKQLAEFLAKLPPDQQNQQAILYNRKGLNHSVEEITKDNFYIHNLAAFEVGASLSENHLMIMPWGSAGHNYKCQPK